MVGDGIRQDNTLRVAAQVEAAHARTRLRGGEVLVSIVGTVGRVAVVPDELMGWNVARAVAVLRPSVTDDAQWLRYALLAPAVQDQMQIRKTDTVQATLNLRDLRNLMLPWPDPDERRRIASVLGALDDLIETDRHLASRIAEQLTTMFGSLSALQEQSFFDVFDVDFGAAFKGEHFSEPGTGLPLLRIRDLKTLRSDVWTTERIDGDVLVMPGDVVVGMDAEFRATRWLGGPSLLNQRVCRVRAKSGSLAWTREALVAPLAFVEGHKTGTTVAHLNKRDLAELRIAVPSDEVLSRFDARAEPLHRAIVALQDEIDQLTRTRDELLPLLMSGKVRVSEALAVA
jgi:type I restriction enzyme S subunit